MFAGPNDFNSTGDLFGNGPNAGVSGRAEDRRVDFCAFSREAGESEADTAVRFLQTLRIPQGENAGKPLTLAPFQEQFVRGSLADGITTAVLSIGRGNAKTALSAGIALGGLVGAWDRQPRREILIAARTRDQGQVAYNFARDYCEYLPLEMQRRFIFRRAPRLEIEYEGPCAAGDRRRWQVRPWDCPDHVPAGRTRALGDGQGG